MSQEMSLNTSPPTDSGSKEPQPPQPPPGYPTAASPDTTRNNDALLQERKNWFDDMRGWVMVVAVLVASVTYTTGLNPPGGFWQEDHGDHKAGSAILRDKLPHRYTIFFYANGTAFMASLVIIVLLMNEKFYCNTSNVVLLNMIMVLDLVALMISYAAGAARSSETSIFLIALAVVVLLFVLSSVHFLPHLCSCTRNRAPWVSRCVGSGITGYGEINRSDRAGPAVNSSQSAVSIAS